MNKFFLYGARNVGKSTLISNIVDFLGIIPAGFKTVSDSADMLGDWSLYMVDANNPSMQLNARNRVAYCRADGDWEAYTNVFNDIGVDLLTFTKRPKIIIMDELGFMEKDAYIFQKRVLDLLDEPLPVLGVIKPSLNPFAQKIVNHPNVKTFEITTGNRDGAFVYLTRMLSKFVGNIYSAGYS